MFSKAAEATFPNTLEGYGYAFNEGGQLRKIDPKTGKPGSEPFEFAVKSSHDYNQRRYEALGDVITEHIYTLLETETGLKRMPVPKEGPESTSSFIFISPDAFSNPERLLILIHGSGAVRAGQWSRRLIINDDLQCGTQIPFVKRARELGYAVIVLNPNENYSLVNGKRIGIKGSDSPTEHANYVWNHYVKEIKPKYVAVIAHSYGGFMTVDLASEHFSEFQAIVFAIAFTDSVHGMRMQKIPAKISDYLKKVGRNWAAHNTAVGTPIATSERDIPRVSAGNSEHERTSWSSFESIFAFLQERYKAVTTKNEL